MTTTLPKFNLSDLAKFKKDVSMRLSCPSGDYTAIQEFPANIYFDSNSVFSAGTVFNDAVSFGDNCTVGARSVFNGRSSFGEFSVIGEACSFEKFCKIGPFSSIGARTKFLKGCSLEEKATIGYGVDFYETSNIFLPVLSCPAPVLRPGVFVHSQPLAKKHKHATLSLDIFGVPSISIFQLENNCFFISTERDFFYDSCLRNWADKMIEDSSKRNSFVAVVTSIMNSMKL